VLVCNVEYRLKKEKICKNRLYSWMWWQGNIDWCFVADKEFEESNTAMPGKENIFFLSLWNTMSVKLTGRTIFTIFLNHCIVKEIVLLLDTHVRCVSSVMMQNSPEAGSCYSAQNPRIKMELLTFYRYVNIVTKENFNVFITWNFYRLTLLSFHTSFCDLRLSTKWPWHECWANSWKKNRKSWPWSFFLKKKWLVECRLSASW
jgi:hypothetical protein